MKFEDIKGMGKSRIQKLKAAGISCPLDLLLHFPYKYVNLSEKADISKLNDGDELTVCGTVVNEPKIQYLRKGLKMTKAVLNTCYGEIEAVWFNQKYIASALPNGKTVYVTGKIKKFRNKISLSAPVMFHPSGNGVLPLYRNIPGIPQRVFSEAVDMLLSRAEVFGYIPDSVRKKYKLPSLGDAFKQVHRPDSVESAYAAARALSLEKLSYTLSMYTLAKSAKGHGKKFVYAAEKDALSKAVKALSFELTDGQKAALEDILTSLRGDVPMNRLLQGDVGCGKTAVALLAMYYAYICGYQSVLMAPTEILAVQHYKSAIAFLEKLGARAVLLCGSMGKKEKDDALFKIRTKAADIIIGTHALISDGVEFNKLALIITDEQQRFGVNQRGNLENKAVGADILVMTATPIPRTLALCMYGELEQSFIRGLPSGRPEIVTRIVAENKFESMFEYVNERASFGERTYIVCPRIEADDEEELVSVTEMYSLLKAKYPSAALGVIHGKMKDTEKSEIMNKFICGDTQILISTTVIEVGIDVPAATNIIIFNSERYGLSQLHQLRGRVGRGTLKSYCFLPFAGDVPERLKFFCTCNDGFELSEYDFAQRGAGDFIGTRQHGESNDLPVKIDSELIEAAKAISEATLGIEEARQKLRACLKDGAEEYVSAVTMN